MKKSVIALLAALLALVIVVSLSKRAAKSDIRSKPALDKSQLEKLSAFKVTYKEDSTVLRKQDDVWLTALDDFAADTAKINKALTAFRELEDREIVSRNPEREKEYGLDSSSVRTVTLMDEGGQPFSTLEVGKTSSADYSTTYWRRQGSPEVYRTPGKFSYDMSGAAEDWVEKKLYFFDKEDVRRLEVRWVDSTGTTTSFTVEAEDVGKWVTVKPEKGKANKSHAETLAGRFKQMRIDDFVEDGDSLGLVDPPTIWAKATLIDGAEHTLQASLHGDKYYVQHPKRNDLVILNKWRLEVFNKTWDDIHEPPEESSDTTQTAGGESQEEKADFSLE